MNKTIKKINIVVIGVGHLGEHHVKHLKSIDSFKLIGIHDINEKRAKSIGTKYGIPLYNNINELIEACDSISLVTPTETHFDIAYHCIKAKKHIFIEKPIAKSVNDAEKLIKLGNDKNVIIQVGHIERFNPALIPLKNYTLKPKYIEIQRLAPYNIRGTDVPVVLDKMIHDLDILLFLVNSDIETIYANGISILTDSIDIANSRIRFKNGTIANVTSSRVAQDDVRKIKIFQQDLYITIDLLIGLTEVYRIVEKNEKNITAIKDVDFDYHGKKKHIIYEKPKILSFDALKAELENFADSINGISKPMVDGAAAKNALELAIKIDRMIREDLH